MIIDENIKNYISKNKNLTIEIINSENSENKTTIDLLISKSMTIK